MNNKEKIINGLSIILDSNILWNEISSYNLNFGKSDEIELDTEEVLITKSILQNALSKHFEALISCNELNNNDLDSDDFDSYEDYSSESNRLESDNKCYSKLLEDINKFYFYNIPKKTYDSIASDIVNNINKFDDYFIGYNKENVRKEILKDIFSYCNDNESFVASSYILDLINKSDYFGVDIESIPF